MSSWGIHKMHPSNLSIIKNEPIITEASLKQASEYRKLVKAVEAQILKEENDKDSCLKDFIKRNKDIDALIRFTYRVMVRSKNGE